MRNDENHSIVAVKSVKSSERTLHLLEVLAAHPVPLAITELHRLTGYPRSSLHQLLHTMAGSDWIDMSDDGSQVSVGARALIMGTSYLDRDPALPEATDAVVRACSELGYAVQYMRLVKSNVLTLITRTSSEFPTETSSLGRSGRLLPAHATASGKALLSERSDQERHEILGNDSLIAVTPHTITDQRALEEDLDMARYQHFSVEKEESTIGVCSVGVTVPYRIPATDAISCALPVARASEKEIERVATTLGVVAAQLAKSFGRSGIR